MYKKTIVIMVVMDTEGRGFLGEPLLGSVSHSAARQATVLTLLVPAKDTEE